MAERDAVARGVAAGRQAYDEAKREAAARPVRPASRGYSLFRRLGAALVLFGYVVGISEVFSHHHPLDWVLIAGGVWLIARHINPPWHGAQAQGPVKGPEQRAA